MFSHGVSYIQIVEFACIMVVKLKHSQKFKYYMLFYTRTVREKIVQHLWYMLLLVLLLADLVLVSHAYNAVQHMADGR